MVILVFTGCSPWEVTKDVETEQNIEGDKVVGWQRYSDQENFFSIQYPSQWKVIKTSDESTSFAMERNASEGIDSTRSTMTVRTVKTDPFSNTDGYYEKTNEKKVDVNGFSADYTEYTQSQKAINEWGQIRPTIPNEVEAGKIVIVTMPEPVTNISFKYTGFTEDMDDFESFLDSFQLVGRNE